MTSIADLSAQLDFVGQCRKVPWFNSALAHNQWFSDLIACIQAQHPDASVQNLLYALFAHSECIAYRHGVWCEGLFESFTSWQVAIEPYKAELCDSVARFGTQGNIPQRAAIVLDHLCRAGLLGGGEEGGVGTVVEFGCSTGLLGRVFANASTLFGSTQSMDDYFWLGRTPHTPPQTPVIKYVGVDRIIPPDDLVPFFLADRERRGKIVRFMEDVPSAGVLHQEDVWHFLDRTQGSFGKGKWILLTAFVLYHFTDPGPLVRRIMSMVQGAPDTVVWLDLSRAQVVNALFPQYERNLTPAHVYLRHDGRPVVSIDL